MKPVLALVLLILVGCATPPAPRDCPPLPTLPDNPTREQRAKHLDSILALYVRCAKGP